MNRTLMVALVFAAGCAQDQGSEAPANTTPTAPTKAAEAPAVELTTVELRVLGMT